jgi:hypothetical protein
MQELVDILQNVQKFKTEGTGPIRFNLGMDFILFITSQEH